MVREQPSAGALGRVDRQIAQLEELVALIDRLALQQADQQAAMARLSATLVATLIGCYESRAALMDYREWLLNRERNDAAAQKAAKSANALPGFRRF